MARASSIKNGDIFGRLTVINANCSRSNTKESKLQSECICECGNKTIVVNNALRTGNTKGCGCHIHKPRHGHCRRKKLTKAYQTWRDMKQRCNNPTNEAYKDYGGRGIQICESWYKFENFLADMGEPTPKMTLDRIDVNGNYEPSNCRWTNRKVQANNKRNTYYVSFNERTQTLTDWAEELGIKYTTLQLRLRRGWCVEKALTTTVILKNRKSDRGMA